jgi:hypothetical protein
LYGMLAVEFCSRNSEIIVLHTRKIAFGGSVGIMASLETGVKASRMMRGDIRVMKIQPLL